MIKSAKIVAIAIVLLLSVAPSAMAQQAGPPSGSAVSNAPGAWNNSFTVGLSGAFGVGLVAIGAAMGIGKLASSALESMARQPEVAGNIQTAMIIAAALIEGFTFYALWICSTQNPWAQLIAQ